MDVAVWDTYVSRGKDKIMHFDIIVPIEVNEKDIIRGFGQRYLESKQIESQNVKIIKCQFCHIEEVQEEWEQEIYKNGYYILEMENCD